MQSFKGPFFIALLVVLCLLSAQPMRAEVVATNGETKIVALSPLRNGLSTLTVVWPIDTPTQERVTALKAGLVSVVSGGTSSRAAHKVSAFLRSKGIKQNITTNGRNLLLTFSAPSKVFPETLVHLENVLLESEYSRDWYERVLENLNLKISSKSGRPSDVLIEITNFLEYERDDAAADERDPVLRFGRPSQVIFRSEDQEVVRRVRRLLKKLPKAKWELPFANWAEALSGLDKQSFALPTGVIHFEDPNSTEMLILFVKAEEFKDEYEQIGANLLVDYIGANQGSEMFRIVRQEMRAAYDPRSDFIIMNKNKAAISFSATVEAAKWFEVYEKIREIYEGARKGKIERAGLGVRYDKLRRSYFEHFFNHPVWGTQRFLNEYPDGVDGTINIPLFAALEEISLDELVANSEAYLPPLDDFLLVLIGGGNGTAY